MSVTTAELALGPNWRERIEHELDSHPVQTAERIYDVLATLPGTPTYAAAWAAVRAKLLVDVSDVRVTTVQAIFDSLWQTLCAEWNPNGDDEADAEVLADEAPTVPLPTAA